MRFFEVKVKLDKVQVISMKKVFCVRAGEFAWAAVHLVNDAPRWGVYNSIKLFNVNELQHFLRLCGIDKEIEL